jgi:hypothetical protein
MPSARWKLFVRSGRDPLIPPLRGVLFAPELFTDLCKLTRAQAYHAEQMDQVALFEPALCQMPANVTTSW